MTKTVLAVQSAGEKHVEYSYLPDDPKQISLATPKKP